METKDGLGVRETLTLERKSRWWSIETNKQFNLREADWASRRHTTVERFRFIGEQLNRSEVEVATEDGIVALALQTWCCRCRPLVAGFSLVKSAFVFLFEMLLLVFWGQAFASAEKDTDTSEPTSKLCPTIVNSVLLDAGLERGKMSNTVTSCQHHSSLNYNITLFLRNIMKLITIM